MIIVIKPDASEEAIDQLKNSIQDQGLIVQDIKGENARMLGLAGYVKALLIHLAGRTSWNRHLRQGTV